MVFSKKGNAIIFLVLICGAIMGYIDAVLQPDYAIKSLAKVVLFLFCPLIYAFFSKNNDIFKVFKLNKASFKFSALLAIGVFTLILGGYFLIGGYFDFSSITKTLEETVGVNANNFIFVATYIALVNSLLEEFFFRGFAFLSLSKVMGRKFSYIFSSLCFAFYHVAMMIGWFSIWVFILAVVAIAIGGLIFNYLNETSQSIYPSWMVHMFANFAINIVGFILFGII